ncbi:MAG: hypothetical protein H9W81_15545 [Enterococcus sp.]|nr:hypothetical protein [Enterococcus sp.]
MDKLADDVLELKKGKEPRHPAFVERTIRSVTPIVPDEDSSATSSSEASIVPLKLKGRRIDAKFNSSDSDSSTSEATSIVLKTTSKATKKKNKKKEDTQKIRLRSDDLPKFYGNKDDVETWIQTVSAIWESTGAPEATLLSILPLLLKGKASKWYVSLGKERRELSTWRKWKTSFRMRWLTANHDAKLKKKGIFRRLMPEEDLFDYFDEKTTLQRYVWPDGTTDRELIDDIIDGLPEEWHPILRTALKRHTTVSDFRRILMDYEVGLRRSSRPEYRKTVTTNTRVEVKPSIKPYTVTTTKNVVEPSLPKTPCYNCGKMHWRRDCPEARQAQTNNINPVRQTQPTIAKPYRPNNAINGVPLTRNKWLENSNASNHAKANVVLPMNNPNERLEDDLHTRYIDKLPTYAQARFDTLTGTLHDVCLDTGSAISVIDSAYVNKFLPHLQVQPANTIRLSGIGSNVTQGIIDTMVHFPNKEGKLTSIHVVFHVATSLSTKIIIGNDALVTEGAKLDLDLGIATFKTLKGSIIIQSRKTPAQLEPIIPAARTTQVFTVKPGYQAHIPIIAGEMPETELYYLDPANLRQDIQVSRSVAKTKDSQHFAHVMNIGHKIVKLTAGTLLGHLRPVLDSRHTQVVSNNAQPETEEDRQAFQKALVEVDINPDLSSGDQEKLRNASSNGWEHDWPCRRHIIPRQTDRANVWSELSKRCFAALSITDRATGLPTLQLASSRTTTRLTLLRG